MLGLSSLLRPNQKKRKRIGRGPGSGNGKTAGRGTKGQKSRSGFVMKKGFEGGQMPLHRRLPKRGFARIKRKIQLVDIGKLLKNFDTGQLITKESLVLKRILRSEKKTYKIVGLVNNQNKNIVVTDDIVMSKKLRASLPGKNNEKN